MRLPLEAHRRLPCRVHALAHDFTLLDAWSIPIEADEARGDNFESFVDFFFEHLKAPESIVVRVLFDLRLRLGRFFGWDDASRDRNRKIPGCEETSVADRLSAADRARNRVKEDDVKAAIPGIRAIYRFEDEMLAEIPNATIHALLHLAWIDRGDGKRSAQLAIYVKSRGRMSDAYMALIAPFRHYIVYPSLAKTLVTRWTPRKRPASGIEPLTSAV